MDRFEAKRIKQAQLAGVAEALEAAIEKGRRGGGLEWADGDKGMRVYVQPSHCSVVPVAIRKHDLWRINCLVPAIMADFLQTSRVIEGALVTLRISEGENREEGGGKEESFLILNVENSLMLPDGVRFLNRESDIGSAIWERGTGETITLHRTPPAPPVRIFIVSVR